MVLLNADQSAPSSSARTPTQPQSSSFLEIPASMMEKMLEKTNEVGAIINDSINGIRKNRNRFREELKDSIRRHDDEDTTTKNADQSACGVDGAYVVERLLGTDLLFSCALVTEGLFSKSQKETFTSAPQPPSLAPADNYEVFVYPEKHDAENAILARAIMLQMEINLAARSTHDVTYMDGSLTTALIHMYKAVNLIKGENAESGAGDNYDGSFVSNKIKSEFEDFLASYKKILLGDGNDSKFWVGVPKYTSRNDIGRDHNWPAVYDDRAILTIVLEPGEYTKPVLFTDDEAWHSNLPYQSDRMEELMGDVMDGIRKLHVVYYKPYRWSPAIRVEIPSYIAEDKDKLGILMQNLKSQCEIPSILEPYPLYMADRIAKRISPAIPAYKQIITNRLIGGGGTDQNESDILFMMHSYRTETGFS
jgi:hypothetical protein